MYGRYFCWSVDERRCRTGLNPAQQLQLNITRWKISMHFTWATDFSMIHNHCRHASCLQSATPSVLSFHCHGNEQYMYTLLHSATLTPVLCYYGFPFHPVFQLGTHVGRVEPGSECEPVHSNIHAWPLDYTATVQATNTVLKCELCTLAYILHEVEGQSFKMVATCIHTLHTFPCNGAIRIFRK